MNSRFVFKVASLFALVASTVAQAAPTKVMIGGKEAHGGIAYVCRDSSKVIIFARLLDLWEGEDLKPWNSADPVDTQIERALERMANVSPDTASQIRVDLDYVRKNTYFTGRLLTPTADAEPPYQADEGCAYEQVARYEGVVLELGKNGLKVNREIFDSPHFSNSDRAALYLHEAIYSRDRTSNDVENSYRTRIVVAHLFSESSLPNAIRLTIASVLGVKMPVQIGEDIADRFKVGNQFLALRDPKTLNLTFSFRRYGPKDDPMSIYRDQTSRYRCKVEALGQKGNWTRWMSIREMNGYDEGNRPTETGPAKFPMTFVSSGKGFDQTLEAKCEKKTSSGKISEVNFTASATVDQGVACLYHHGDGNVSQWNDERCDFDTKSFHFGGRFHTGLMVIRIVPAE